MIRTSSRPWFSVLARLRIRIGREVAAEAGAQGIALVDAQTARGRGAELNQRGNHIAGAPDAALLLATAGVATIGIAAAGTLYGVLSAGLRVRETILPILLLPVLAPVLIGATRAFDDALGTVAVDGWNWLALLGLTAVVYVAFGALAFGVLLEDS